MDYTMMDYTVECPPPFIPGTAGLLAVPQHWGLPCVRSPLQDMALLPNRGGIFLVEQGSWHIMVGGEAHHFTHTAQDVIDFSVIPPTEWEQQPNIGTYHIFPMQAGQPLCKELLLFWEQRGCQVEPLLARRNHNALVLGQVATDGSIWLEPTHRRQFQAGDYLVQTVRAGGGSTRLVPQECIGYEFSKLVDPTRVDTKSCEWGVVVATFDTPNPFA